jgi:hypothetical protein
MVNQKKEHGQSMDRMKKVWTDACLVKAFSELKKQIISY